MKVKALKLANIRAVEAAEFRFQPDFNLIVGANGVGKSSVLDALRICMSRVLPSVTESRTKAMSFDVKDIRGRLPFLDAELSVSVGTKEFSFTRREWREAFAADDHENIEKLRRQLLDSERLGDRRRTLLRQLDDTQGVSDTDTFVPSRVSLQAACSAATSTPNCIFFSTARSAVSHAKTRSRSPGGKAAAYYDALISRPLYVAQIAERLRAQETLAREQPWEEHNLRVLQKAVSTFLPAYKNLRSTGVEAAIFDKEVRREFPRLQIDSRGSALEVDWLSDGERGVLGLVLELARRLSQANPALKDPLREGEAIVLIDEIDLHLHPQWQRQIVRKLRKTFPRCQFIATTHSPQVIGEVEHDRIHVMVDGEVYTPTHSFGVDSSRVLEEVMGTEPRSSEIHELLRDISEQVGGHQYENARGLLAKLVARLGEDDPEVTRVSTLLDFMEGEE